MKLKRIISTVVIIATMLLLSVSSFAYTDFDGEYSYVGVASKSNVSVGDTFDLKFYIKDNNAESISFNMDDASYISKLEFDKDAFELTSEAVYGYSFASGQTTYSTANTTGLYQIQADSTAYGDINITQDIFFIKYSFKVKNDAVAGVKNFTAQLVSLNDGNSLADISDAPLSTIVDSVTVTAPAPAPTPISPVASTEIKVGNTTYTDVVNFASSVSGSGAKLSFDLFENGTKHGNTYSVNLADWGLTIEEGTLNFKVAIIGAPSTGVTMNNITLGN